MNITRIETYNPSLIYSNENNHRMITFDISLFEFFNICNLHHYKQTNTKPFVHYKKYNYDMNDYDTYVEDHTIHHNTSHPQLFLTFIFYTMTNTTWTSYQTKKFHFDMTNYFLHIKDPILDQSLEQFISINVPQESIGIYKDVEIRIDIS